MTDNTGIEASANGAARAVKKPRHPSPRELEAIRLLLEREEYAGAEKAARELKGRYRKNPLAWQVFSVALYRRGRTEESIGAAETAANLAPEDVEVRFELAGLLGLCGRLAEAESEYRKALALDPGHCNANLNLGVTLKSLGRVEQAEDFFRRALAIEPWNTLARSNLALVLCQSGRFSEAEEHYKRAIALDPNFAGLHSNLASLLVRCGRLKEAEGACRRALELMPALAPAWNNLGETLQAAGRTREAIESYRQALALSPEYSDGHSNLLFCLSHDESVEPEELFAAHLEYGRRFEAPLRSRWPRHANSRDPERRLNIGFVSGDFRDHAVAFFLEPMLSCLAGTTGIALHGYSNSLIEDQVTARLRGHFRVWRRIAGIADEAVAAQIESDAIDISIDLSGHTSGNRLPVFARKPAPVQASWIGYPGTTGLEAMDYYLGDRFFLPLDRFASQFTEKIAHLPAVSPFSPSSEAPPVNPLPALSNGHLTVASFNRPGKLSAAVIALWSRLLHALPDARMVIGALPVGGATESLLAWFAANDIPPERLEFRWRSGMGDYLALHRQVDFCVDAFPYGGCTTTSHALWMGTPTLSIEGRTAAGREGTTFLKHLGLEEFIAADGDDFVRKGTALGSRLEHLAGLRGSLRERLRNSALGRPDVIADGLSGALRRMWRRWCAGLPPEAF